MGKTSLALDLTRHIAVELKRPVGVFSLEMRSDEIGLMTISTAGRARAPPIPGR
jgi:replicative DNA helicase